MIGFTEPAKCQAIKKVRVPFIKICTPENMIGFTEPAKCQAIKKVRLSFHKDMYSGKYDRIY